MYTTTTAFIVNLNISLTPLPRAVYIYIRLQRNHFRVSISFDDKTVLLHGQMS